MTLVDIPGRRAAGFMAVVGGCVGLLAFAAFAQVPTGHVSPPGVPVRHPGQDSGPVDTAQPITISLLLPLRNKKDLDNLVASGPGPGGPLGPGEFAARFGPTQDQVNAVEAAAAAFGLHTVDVSGNHTVIKEEGTVGQVDAAFGVRLEWFVDDTGYRYWAPADSVPVIPPSLHDKITGVLGLDTYARARPMIHPGVVPDTMAPR
ncbi:MAG: protease pro-enzyme activation domain-containing protein [Capsulimonadaceae bacterium]